MEFTADDLLYAIPNASGYMPGYNALSKHDHKCTQ